MENKMTPANLSFASWWINKGKWRSYNTMFDLPLAKSVKTTALGNIVTYIHRHLYEGIKRGGIIWKME